MNSGSASKPDSTSLSGFGSALPLAVIYAVGFMSATFLPVWVSAMAEAFNVSPSRVGLVGSIELGFLAAASILTAALPDNGNRRSAIAVALVVNVAANLLSTVSSTMTLFLITRVVAGTTNGFLLATVNRRAGRSASPRKVFAGQTFTIVMFATLFFTAAPYLLAHWGPGASFYFAAIAGVVALATVSLISVTETGLEPEIERPRGAATDLGAVLLLAAPTVAFFVHGTVWAYLAPAARNAGASLQTLAYVLALGGLFNPFAPLVAGWIGSGRILARAALIGGIVMFTVCLFCVAGSGNAKLFAVGLTFQPFFLMFLLPFYLERLSQLDRTGKFVAASSACLMIGTAVGPTVGGLIIDYDRIAGLAVFDVGMMAVVLVFTLAGLFRRRSRLDEEPEFAGARTYN